MGLSLLLYVILDGFDRAQLLPFGSNGKDDDRFNRPLLGRQRDLDCHGRGRTPAFPKAHSVILTALYIPVTIMLVGLILRGAAFDFRVKSADHRQLCGTSYRPWIR